MGDDDDEGWQPLFLLISCKTFSHTSIKLNVAKCGHWIIVIGPPVPPVDLF